MKNTNNSSFEATLHKSVANKEGAVFSLLRLCLGIGIGFLLPQATVYGGFMPFGVGLAAAVSGGAALPIFIATLIGYAFQGVSVAMRYIAALVAVAGIRWSVSGFKAITQTKIFPAAVAFLSTLITGSALLLSSNPGLMAAMTIIAESLLSGAFAFAVAHLFQNKGQAFSLPVQLSACLVFAVGLMVLFSVEWGGISPGRILAAFAVLLAGRCGKISGGCFMGVLLSVALLLTEPAQLYLAQVYAFSGVMAAVLSKKGKWITAVAFSSVALVISIPTQQDITVLISLYETLSACIFFLLIPPKAERFVAAVFAENQPSEEVVSTRQSAAFKLDCAAKAMAEVAGVVDTVSEQLSHLGAPELGTAYRKATDKICRTCKKKITCWEKNFQNTMDSLNHLTPFLQAGETISTEQLFGYLKTDCLHQEELINCLIIGYQDFSVREAAFRRLQELRSVVNDQFSGTASLLQELSFQFCEPEYSDTQTEQKLRDIFDKQHIALHSISCRVSGKQGMIIELLLDGKYHTKNAEAFRQKIGELCGRSFSGPVLEYAAGTTRVSFTERHAFRVAVGFSQLVCNGEKLCGDAVELFEDGSGRHITVLSDGMGCGGGAAVDSAMAVGLAVRMLKAGFGYESMLKMINTAIMAKAEDESLATLDIAVINLFTGDLELLKAGAGVSLLYSNGRVSRLEESSLPLGILHELTFAQTHDRLVDGDVLLLMSDGVSNDGVEWVEELLRNYDMASGDVQRLAQLIVNTARDRQTDDKGDDVTVVALAVYRIK